ncbi:LOW QUALITY PROTEIN: uncharacterized protein LOC124833098 [Vigna umbellata]|uniref:LOW QUALITY PROTEIN: uncharacterized protein LOC124833098 n=1 Tax=Vigna umbellata TaxID=87088 RepID=UPI001F5EC5AF|nr:LOW QUALITY PROTEIN: uncharacterized protein LOC124833098 [Vigna umbellata]
MAFTSCSIASRFLPPRKNSAIPFHLTTCTAWAFPTVLTPRHPPFSLSSTSATCSATPNSNNNATSNSIKNQEKEKEVEVEVEEELPWIQEKALDLVEFTGSVTQAIPGPRVGPTSLPWILAVPLAYATLTFVIAFVKTVKKFSSPKAKRRRLVSKNATLCKSLDDLFQNGRHQITHEALVQIQNKTGFGLEEILRKYIRYSLNEKAFNPDMVADLIQLRRASMLSDSHVAEILNEISRRIVRDKGPIVMDKSGYTEKGFKRKIAVQALFGKVFYLSELPEFCSRDSSLVVKEIFGVTDEDADKLRSTRSLKLGVLMHLRRWLMVQIQRMLVTTSRPLSAIILQCLPLEMAKEYLMLKINGTTSSASIQKIKSKEMQ